MEENTTVINTNPYINQAQDGTTATQNADTNSSTVSNLLSGFDTNKFLLGALVGAVGAYILTNENAQKAIFKTVAKGGALFSAGIEEMKERFEDAKAEMEASKE